MSSLMRCASDITPRIGFRLDVMGFPDKYLRIFLLQPWLAHGLEHPSIAYLGLFKILCNLRHPLLRAQFNESKGKSWNTLRSCSTSHGTRKTTTTPLWMGRAVIVLVKRSAWLLPDSFSLWPFPSGWFWTGICFASCILSFSTLSVCPLVVATCRSSSGLRSA